ncbi:hypothetical protein OSTOST_00434 [Ostertagia ostertagi]
MGICGSCLRLLLDAESDVKIHVIEPTSIGVEHSVAVHNCSVQQPGRTAPTLQVPETHSANRSEMR